MSLCAECRIPAVVGWGNPPVWLCQAHFDEHLAKTRTVLFDRAARWLYPDGTVEQADYSGEVS